MNEEVKYVAGDVVEDMLRQYNDEGECYGEVRVRWFGFDGKDNANVVTRDLVARLSDATSEWEQVRKEQGKK